MYIAVAGATSEKRRSFIDVCTTGHEPGGLVDDDSSVKAGVVHLWTCNAHNCRMHLVEIPDFDTTDLTNYANITAFRSMASILASAYGTESGSRVNGVIYIGMVGEGPLPQLLELALGKMVYSSFTGNPLDADAICGALMQQQPGPMLPIQKELIAEKRKLQDTTLGSVIFSALQAAVTKASVLVDNNAEDDPLIGLEQSIIGLGDTYADSEYLRLFCFPP
jgi:hypothetical protein